MSFLVLASTKPEGGDFSVIGIQIIVSVWCLSICFHREVLGVAATLSITSGGNVRTIGAIWASACISSRASSISLAPSLAMGRVLS
jgi:hypothetical protein